MRRLAPAAAAAALTALLLAGCTAGGVTSTIGPAVELPPGQIAPDPGMVEGEAAEGFAGSADTQPADRSVVTTGSISVTVDDPITSAAVVADLAVRAGGRVDNRTETPGTDTQPPNARLTLRVPSDELDAVVEQLRELGAVNSVSMNASDVTQQRQDLDARIEALTTSVDRLQELLRTATSIADLIAIESELTTRQSELDSLTQQRDWLVDQVDFSTLTVDLVTEEVAPTAAPDDFWSGLVAGWAALLAFASWVGVAFGVLLPWLGMAVVVAAIVITIVVLSTRRKRNGHADAAASVAQATTATRSPDAPPPPSSGGTPRA